MARPLRLEFAGALYHVTSRGDGREAIFRGDGDRPVFFDVLAGVWERFNWVIHAYCLMTNHYHLLVQTPDGNLAKGMRELNGVYTHSGSTGSISGSVMSSRGATRRSWSRRRPICLSWPDTWSSTRCARTWLRPPEITRGAAIEP